MHTPDLIYDWNKNHPPGLKPPGPVLINDETLRDGLQSPVGPRSFDCGKD